MFGLFKRKKPANALDELIIATYGNPPPPKRANLHEAVLLAHEELLQGLVSTQDIKQLASALDEGPIPYSTHDLAISVALSFFREPDRHDILKDAQLLARVKALEWAKEQKVAKLILKTFEDDLYERYKP